MEQISQMETAQAQIDRQERRIRRLERLVEASEALNSTLDLGKLIEIILNITTEHTSAERASLFLRDTERNELFTLIASGLDQQEIRLPIGKGLVGFVAESGETLNLADAYEDPRFDRSIDKISGYRTRTLLVLPVRERGGRVVGVLELLNKKGGHFTEDDIDFVESISVQAAMALDNARLHKESLERQKLEKELQLARAIQRSLLPDGPPRIALLDMAVRHETSLHVGGDYYDFIRLSDDTLLFVVADVEGKGAAAAMVMANVQATLHTLVRHVHSIEGVLYHLNERILEGTRGGKYLTMFLGLIDIPRRGLHYINAGHVAPVILRPDGPVYLKEGGMVVGLLPGARYRRGHLVLRPGDVILTCTDGITEANTPAEEQYGAERMAQKAMTVREGSAQEIVDTIFEDVSAFSRGGPHQDDKVLMGIKVN